MVATYNAFSPATAVGAGLSSVVKINGLQRQTSSNSTVPVDIGGTIGTVINAGVVGDNFNNRWDLPATVEIGTAGVITVTATCETPGAIYAEIGAVTQILTPQPDWQTAYNSATAAPGAPVETDYTLRLRQSVSTALPAQGIREAILANVLNVPGVQRGTLYENDSNVTDADSLPPHSIAVVTEGGDAIAICTAIMQTKPPGSYTYGSVGETIVDSAGMTNLIRYFPVILVRISIIITIAPLDGWLSAYGTRLIQQMSNFVSTLPIGYDSYLSKLYTAAQLPGAANLTYDVTNIEQGRQLPWFSFDTPGRGFDESFWFAPITSGTDVEILFNEAALSLPADISLVFTTLPE
jgi:hypothetical protein